MYFQPGGIPGIGPRRRGCAISTHRLALQKCRATRRLPPPPPPPVDGAKSILPMGPTRARLELAVSIS